MGGQVADQGTIVDEDGNLCAKVTDVQHAPNGQNLHTVEVITSLSKDHQYKLSVDRKFHALVEHNHTATHLLDQSLRNVLGDHTQQAGSLVEPNYLRFDFTHFGSVTKEDLQKVEDLVNEEIFKAEPVTTVETDQETGKKMGAIALFDSKYGDKVRVVSAGDYSVEFCGGNHVSNTSQIGLFKIVSESGVGAGVRRIEAVTSKAAFDYLNNEEALLKQVADQVKTIQVKEVPNKVAQLQEQIKDLQQKQDKLESKIASQQANSVFDDVKQVNGNKIITGVLNVSGMDQLRQLADTWRSKKLSDVLVLGTQSGEKANLIVAVSDEKVKDGMKAGDIIKSISKEINGGGGGRPNMAQAGGSKPEGLPKAMEAAVAWLENF